jgi:hypothetical protein
MTEEYRVGGTFAQGSSGVGPGASQKAMVAIAIGMSPKSLEYMAFTGGPLVATKITNARLKSAITDTEGTTPERDSPSRANAAACSRS